MIPTKPLAIKKLYQLMYDVDKLFYQNKIQYFAIAGTLLGAMRHKGIIPWDDDLDIGVLDKYIPIIKSKEFKDQLNKCGYTLTKFFFGYKIHAIENDKWLGLDIFVMEYKDNRYQFESEKAREIWPKEYFEVSELYPLQRVKFGSFEITVPAESKKALSRWFKNWERVAYQGYNHELDEHIDPPIEVKLNPTTRKPAKPFTVKKKICNSLDRFPAMYFINCAKHKERLCAFREQFNKKIHQKLVLPKRVPCVYGKSFSDTKLCKMIDEGIIKDRADLTRIEVSISLSHLKALKKFLDSGDQYAIIMEDDTTLKSKFFDNVTQILSNVPELDVLYFYNGNIFRTRSKLEKVKTISKSIQILKETVPHNPGGVCYLVSKRFAEHLYENAFPINSPWDTYMGHDTYRSDFNYYTVNMLYKWGSRLVSTPKWSHAQSTQCIDSSFYSRDNLQDLMCE